MHLAALFLAPLLGCAPAADEPAAEDPRDAKTEPDTDPDVNEPPSAPVVAITPAIPAAGSDLTVTLVTGSVDPEGDTVRYAYAWSVDGTPRADLVTDTVRGYDTEDGQTWSVAVTPSDGWLEGAPGTASVVIGNAPPVPPTLRFDPAVPGDGDDVTVVFDTAASDPEGEPLVQTIRWYEDGSEVVDAADRTTLEGRHLDTGELIRVVVTVTDGQNTVEAEKTVRAGNLAPVIAHVDVEPLHPEDDEDLEADVAATDPDGDPLARRYAWYRDGVEATDVGDTDTVPAAATTPGEKWSVVVTVTDGMDEVSQGSDAATVYAWTGLVGTQTFSARLTPDGAGGYSAAAGEWHLSLAVQGTRFGDSACELYWTLEGDSSASVCPTCDFAFLDTVTLDTAASTTSGSLCSAYYGDGTGHFSYDAAYAAFDAAHLLSPSAPYGYWGYARSLQMYADGVGGWTYAGTADYAVAYSVTTTEDSAGELVLEAYLYVGTLY